MTKFFTNVSQQERTVGGRGIIGSRLIPVGQALTVGDDAADGYRNQPKVWREEDPSFVAGPIVGGVGCKTGLPVVASPAAESIEVQAEAVPAEANPVEETN